MADPANTVDNHERQLNEIALLQSMYPEELRVVKQPTTPADDFEIDIRLDAGHELSFVLSPHSYPASSVPQVFASFGPNVSNGVRKRLRARLRDIVDQQEAGIECVDLIISDFRQALDDLHAAACHGAAQRHYDAPEEARQSEGLRVVLWMHHLLATSKRRAIVQLSKELGLGGFSKPGYPGSVYVEGEASAVRAFVDELKVRLRQAQDVLFMLTAQTMRWQAIQERASESVPLASIALAPGIQEVQGLGNVAEGLKATGSEGESLATFFLESMKVI
ncbi:hypothetical protein MPH_10186 [Macrophomina phaseolina MS6]|uniref:RWD domain-containing protein n=1 Tax=Macrophomina phaseolina (strain MS6) TaxID=1126212 RepID=K2RIJ2_MACPH|nr:hypothetical protein MPH_10186 [Macrophomina phaseolina MS6]